MKVKEVMHKGVDGSVRTLHSDADKPKERE